MDISCLSSQLKRSNLTSCLIYHLLLSVLDPSIETWENSFCFFWLMSHHNATMILKTVVEVSVSELHSFVWNHWKRNIYKFDTGISLFYRHFGSIFSCHSLKLLCKFYWNLNAGVFQFHGYCTYHTTSYRWRRKGKICTVRTVSLVELLFICLFLYNFSLWLLKK